MAGPRQAIAPDYSGGSLINLMAELEWRLTGASVAPRLHPQLAQEIPDAATYVLVLIDGLGAHQLDHPAARSLREAWQATIHAPFPTTTSASLASVSTGLPPGRHGLLGYLLLLVGEAYPVNTLRWVDSAGRSLDHYTQTLLPYPNLWERLLMAGIEPITVQPASFSGTSLTKVLYRGCRLEGVEHADELARTTFTLARTPGRLVFAYYPAVDRAAHEFGMDSPNYASALAGAATLWDRIAAFLPPHAALVGAADHGMVTVRAAGKYHLRGRDHPDLTLYGDPRSLYVKGPRRRIEELAAHLPAVWCSRQRLEALWGTGEDVEGMDGYTRTVRPDGAFLARDGYVLLPGHMDHRMIGYHGGLTPQEIEIPLLVAAR